MFPSGINSRSSQTLTLCQHLLSVMPTFPDAEAFEKELAAMLTAAESLGFDAVAIRSGTLHRRVGGFPNGGNHRMPTCVGVMRAKMRENLGDLVMEEPPRGAGANVLIMYKLPR